MKRLTNEEIENIYRIEYMECGNWSLGYNRIIFILERINDDDVKRSYYIGDPLSPELTNYNDDKTAVGFLERYLKKEGTIFKNVINAYDVMDVFYDESFYMSNNNMAMVEDGNEYAIAIYTKDKDGNDKLYKDFLLESKDYYAIKLLSNLFDVINPEDAEKAVLRTDIETLSYMPGNLNKLKG